jgi:hypothetical protein
MRSTDIGWLAGSEEASMGRDVRRTLRLAWTVGAVVLVVVVGLPETSTAHVWRTGGTGCNANNSADSANHGFWYNSGLSSAMAGATNWSRTYNYDGTDVNTFNVTALAFDTDVVVYDQDYTTYCGKVWHYPGVPGTVGMAECKSLATNPANACEKFEVRFDESAALAPSTPEAWRRSLACHELGHTLGLTHENTDSCINPDISETRYGLTAANVSWINSHY